MRADFARCSLGDGISSWFAPGLPTWAHSQWLVVNLCQGSLSLPLFPHANLYPQCWLRLSGERCLQAVSFLLEIHHKLQYQSESSATITTMCDILVVCSGN